MITKGWRKMRTMEADGVRVASYVREERCRVTSPQNENITQGITIIMTRPLAWWANCTWRTNPKSNHCHCLHVGMNCSTSIIWRKENSLGGTAYNTTFKNALSRPFFGGVKDKNAFADTPEPPKKVGILLSLGSLFYVNSPLSSKQSCPPVSNCRFSFLLNLCMALPDSSQKEPPPVWKEPFLLYILPFLVGSHSMLPKT